jgi:hypothetical protein
VEDERLQVLRLLDAGRVTPEQALALLDALRPLARPPSPAAIEPSAAARSPQPPRVNPRLILPPAAPSGAGSRWLRLRVLDGRGRSKVDLQVPLSLLGLFLRVGSRWLPQLRAFDPDLVLAVAQWRGTGKLFEAADEIGGDRLEISIE